MNRPVYVTKEYKCFFKDIDGSVAEVEDLVSNHHEADPRCAMHAIYASRSSPNMPICAVSDDTDVFIILLFVASERGGRPLFQTRDYK